MTEPSAENVAPVSALQRGLDLLREALREHEHADTCDLAKSPGEGYRCTCWRRLVATSIQHLRRDYPGVIYAEPDRPIPPGAPGD